MLSLAKAITRGSIPLILTATAAVAQVPQYSFSVIAQTGSSVDGNNIVSFTEPPVLNEQGDLLFVARTAAGQTLILGDRTVTKTGNSVSGNVVTGITSPVTNKSGEIAYIASFATGSGLIKNGNLLRKTGDTVSGQKIFDFYAGLAMNNRGQLAYQVNSGTSFPSTNALIFSGPEDAAKIIASSGQTIGGKTIAAVGTPVLNERGVVAFRVDLPADGDNGTGIVTWCKRNEDGGKLLLETGNSGGGKTFTVFGYPTSISLNNVVTTSANFAGENGSPDSMGFARIARRTQDSEANVQVVVEQGATIEGNTITQFGQAATNDHGMTAFYARYNGGQGIFSPQGVLVKTGDRIGLDTITAILFNSVALNNQGEIAFTVRLSSGATALVRGERQAVTEFRLIGRRMNELQ